MRGGAVTGGASLDLHETKKTSLPGDQVDISRHVARGPAASNYGIPQAAQVEEGRIFASMTSGEMGGKLWIASTARREPVETIQGPFKCCKTELRHPRHREPLSRVEGAYAKFEAQQKTKADCGEDSAACLG